MKFAIAIEAGSEAAAYGVAVPDLPGCFSAGDTVEEAFDNAVEAIKVYVEVLAENGDPIPTTRALSELQKDKGYAGWTWGIVDVPVEKLFGPAEKINITVPALLLKRIDAFADKAGKTRSGFLAEAAVEAMTESATMRVTERLLPVHVDTGRVTIRGGVAAIKRSSVTARHK